MAHTIHVRYSAQAAEAVGSGQTAAYATATGAECGTEPEATPVKGSALCIGETKIGIFDGGTDATVTGKTVANAKTHAQTVYNDLVIARTILGFVNVLYVLSLVGALFGSLAALGTSARGMAMAGAGPRR